MKKYIALAIAALSLTACDDFLDREPLDFGDKDAYFTGPEDFALSCNQFYEYLPLNNYLWGGIYSQDQTSDNQVHGVQSLFYAGEKKTVAKNNSEWNFSHLRAINFFINTAEEAMANGHATGSVDAMNHYVGEGYFFRAYDYFRLLRNFGDVPILTEMLPDDPATLTAMSKRYPRNEVVRFILKDLDKADSLMLAAAPQSGRVYKAVAQALKARVALYEATWEKYHAGTCFVPGNEKWVGKTTWPDFAFKAGSADAEINFFLDQAMEAAKKVADVYELDEDYISMFNRWETVFPANSEVLLARYYKDGVLTHSCSSYLKGGGGCGYTRALVNTFLMDNGLPIYATGSGYNGDKNSYLEMQGRDGRLTSSVRPCANEIMTLQDENGKYYNDTIAYYKPNITGSGNEKSTTGYDVEKWIARDNQSQMTQYNNTSAVPIFRAAECYLIYLEASYLRNKTIDATADRYWRALRKRAGVDDDYNKTIAATVLEKENDLGIYSRTNTVDPTLYNIRRERRCEFIGEGMRLDDLKRWRSLDMMKNYQVEGMNLWEQQWEMWGTSLTQSSAVSQSGVSKYIRPLQASATSVVYEGYTFPKQHYLEPIPLEDFNLTGGYGSSIIYQNPGWPDKVDGTADYSYDCD